jgi:C4-dicarboxylate-specific signal transduction histidine kinase
MALTEAERRDLTERQAAKRRTEDLQAELLHTSRLSAMGQMASTMAHELNQPLTAVMNYLEAARHLLASGSQSAERIDGLMSRAVAQAERAGDVIRQLRQFVSKGETERRAESLNKLVEEALALAAFRGPRDPRSRPQPAARRRRPGADSAGRAQPRAQCRRGDGEGRAPRIDHHHARDAA